MWHSMRRPWNVSCAWNWFLVHTHGCSLMCTVRLVVQVIQGNRVLFLLIQFCEFCDANTNVHCVVVIVHNCCHVWRWCSGFSESFVAGSIWHGLSFGESTLPSTLPSTPKSTASAFGCRNRERPRPSMRFSTSAKKFVAMLLLLAASLCYIRDSSLVDDTWAEGLGSTVMEDSVCWY